MDPIWQQLPGDLVERVCNQLPKVRRMDEKLKSDIVDQFWRVDKMLNYYRMWFGRHDAYYILLDDLNMLNESDYECVYQVWRELRQEERMNYYKSVMQ